MKDLQDIVHELKEKGVALRATEQPVDTGTAAGKAFLAMLGVLAEFETNLRRERQLEGIAAAKACGVYTLVADAAPGLLPRLLQPFAKRDLTPDIFEATRDGDSVRVQISMAAMPAEMVHLVEGNLGQVVGVREVTRRQEITGVARRRAA